VFHHPAAFSAQHEAALTHVRGRSWAKSVLCFADDEPVLAVLPAHLMIDLERLREIAGGASLRLARQEEFGGIWPDCETGATLPFAMERKLRIFVDASLVGEPEMVFKAGTHTEAICVHYWDFAELTRPTVGAFAGRRTAVKPAS
jgi:Ala-tRNA(Pro) deacylase